MEITKQERARSSRPLGVALAALGVVVVLGGIAPFLNAAYFAPGIQRALEAALGRRVSFEKAHFQVFPGPGFSLEKVTIHENSSWGLEPFAHASSLEGRLRLYSLLMGEIRFASVRLVEPSVNLVKRTDGGWNVVELFERTRTPETLPLELFPAIEISRGRIDFKLGTRKTTLYVAECDLSLQPEHGGAVSLQFSGSPARTDRAGNGFGHMRGTAHWSTGGMITGSKGKQTEAPWRLAADITLDPSNLSEVTTLIQGHDIGVHGTISSHARIEGPAGALQIGGELRLEDVHRWDLMPARGDDWRVRYDGTIDVPGQRFDLQTLPVRPSEIVPVKMVVRVNEFLTKPGWSVFATLKKAPVQGVVPLAKRMGLALPAGLEMNGTLDGALSYSNSLGLAGGIAVTNAVATFPNIPPVRAAVANVKISSSSVHIEPAILQAEVGGTLRAGVDFNLPNQSLVATLSADQFPIGALKSAAQAWVGAPAALAAFADGYVTGTFSYRYDALDHGQAAETPAWSGQFQFSNGTLVAPGLAVSLKHAQGRAVFGAKTFDVPRFSATLGPEVLNGSYHYNFSARRPERLHVELAAADLGQLQSALAPALQDEGILSHLPFTRRRIPVWLATRNLEGDLSIEQLSANQTILGPLKAHFIWEGTRLEFETMQLQLAQGLVRGSGNIDLSSYSARSRFRTTADNFSWFGGLLSGEGQWESSGVGVEGLRNFRASGSFSGSDLTIRPGDIFDRASGVFKLSFAEGWPDLRVPRLQVTEQEEDWSGEASTRSDGRLMIDLETGDRQRHLVSALMPEKIRVSTPLTSETGPR